MYELYNSRSILKEYMYYLGFPATIQNPYKKMKKYHGNY